MVYITVSSSRMWPSPHFPTTAAQRSNSRKRLCKRDTRKSAQHKGLVHRDLAYSDESVVLPPTGPPQVVLVPSPQEVALPSPRCPLDPFMVLASILDSARPKPQHHPDSQPARAQRSGAVTRYRPFPYHLRSLELAAPAAVQVQGPSQSIRPRMKPEPSCRLKTPEPHWNPAYPRKDPKSRRSRLAAPMARPAKRPFRVTARNPTNNCHAISVTRQLSRQRTYHPPTRSLPFAGRSLVGSQWVDAITGRDNAHRRPNARTRSQSTRSEIRPNEKRVVVQERLSSIELLTLELDFQVNVFLFTWSSALCMVAVDFPSRGQGCNNIIKNDSKLTKLIKLIKLIKVWCAYNINGYVSIKIR
jgi:hypothetical protein